MRPFFTFGLVAALVVSSQPLGVQAAEPVQVAVGAAAWEPVRERLVVPLQGPAPRLHIQQLAARQFVADLAGCSLAEGAPQGGVVGHSRLSGWSMSAEPSLHGVRVRMTVADDVRPVGRYDAALGGVVFTFVRVADSEPRLAPAPRLALHTPVKPGAVEPRFPTRVHVGETFPVRPSGARRPLAVPTEAANKPLAAAKGHRKGTDVASASGDAGKQRPQGAASPQRAASLAHVSRFAGAPRRIAPAKKKALPTVHPAFAAAAVEARPTHRTRQRAVPMPLVLLAAADPAPHVAARPVRAALTARKPARAAVTTSPKLAKRYTAQRDVVARLGHPAYRPDAEVLAIPVQAGRVGQSAISSVRLNKRWSYIDVAGAVPTFSGVRYQERDDVRFQRWVMARRPGRDVTRVSFAVGVPSRLDVKVTDGAVLVAVRPTGSTLAALSKPAARHEVKVASGKPAARHEVKVASGKPAARREVKAASGKPAARHEAKVASGKPAARREAEVASAMSAAPAAVAAVPGTRSDGDRPSARKPAVSASVSGGAAAVASDEAKPASKPAAATPKLALQAGLARRAALPGLVESRVRRPFYDAERFGLAIPYEGRAPLYRWARRSEQGAVIELKAEVLSTTHLQPEARRTGAWGSWKLSRRAGRGPLALELAFNHPSEVSIAADPERKQLLVIPQPRIAKVAVAEASPVRSALAPLVVDQAGGNLFIPFRGEVPRYVIEQVTPTFAYVVFEAAALRDGGVQFFTPNAHPALNYLLVTQPEGTSTVRLAVSLSQPAAAAVYQDPTNTRLVVTLAQDTPVVQATGPKALRVPEPWPGAARPGPQVQGDRGGAPRS
jgi:hypothetical protein